MAVAEVPTDISAATRVSDEPRDERELWRAAKRDLGAPSPEAHLRWIFWHARAVARLEVGRLALKRVEMEDFEVRQRAMATQHIPSRFEEWEELRPKVALEAAQVYIASQVTFVEVAARVAELFDGMWGRAQK